MRPCAHLDPDRLSFLHAVRVSRLKLPLYGAIPPRDQKAYHRYILHEVLQQRVPPRPARSNARRQAENEQLAASTLSDASGVPPTPCPNH